MNIQFLILTMAATAFGIYHIMASWEVIRSLEEMARKGLPVEIVSSYQKRATHQFFGALGFTGALILFLDIVQWKNWFWWLLIFLACRILIGLTLWQAEKHLLGEKKPSKLN